MTDGESRREGGEYSGEYSTAAVEFRVAARLENLAVLRTVVGAVGMFADLNLDAVADLRLAVDEACTGLIGSAIPEATLAVIIDPRPDVVVVEARTTCDAYDLLAEDSLSWHVLSALADDIQTFRNGDSAGDSAGGSAGDSAGDCVFGITLTTRRAGSSR